MADRHSSRPKLRRLNSSRAWHGIAFLPSSLGPHEAGVIGRSWNSLTENPLCETGVADHARRHAEGYAWIDMSWKDLKPRKKLIFFFAGEARKCA